MIIFDLVCTSEHRFEGWFRNTNDLEDQLATGLLTCPVCGTGEIRKIPTAKHISIKNDTQTNNIPEPTNSDQLSHDLVDRLHEYVEQNYDDVGAEFTSQAREIHYGEREARNIRGIATPNEVKELHEEGITTIPLPPKAIDKKKLN